MFLPQPKRVSKFPCPFEIIKSASSIISFDFIFILFNCVPGIAVPFSTTLAILQSPTSFASIMVASLYTGSPLTITFIIMFGYISFIILINILSKTISPALSIIYAICPAFLIFLRNLRILQHQLVAVEHP